MWKRMRVALRREPGQQQRQRQQQNGWLMRRLAATPMRHDNGKSQQGQAARICEQVQARHTLTPRQMEQGVRRRPIALLRPTRCVAGALKRRQRQL
jgi:hypothetical protein